LLEACDSIESIDEAVCREKENPGVKGLNAAATMTAMRNEIPDIRHRDAANRCGRRRRREV
jgi:hypothetical protein